MPVGDDLLGLLRLGDQTDGGDGERGLLPYPGGERNLVSRPGRDAGARCVATAGDVQQVDAVRLQLLGQPYRLVDGPALTVVLVVLREPVGRRDPEENGQVLGPYVTHGV